MGKISRTETDYGLLIVGLCRKTKMQTYAFVKYFCMISATLLSPNTSTENNRPLLIQSRMRNKRMTCFLYHISTE